MIDATSVCAWEELVQQLLRSNAQGRIFVAVDGVDAAARLHFANELARALRASGRTAVRLSATPGTDDDTVRTAVQMLRTGALDSDYQDIRRDAFFIVDGWSLLRSSIRDAWNFAVFLESDRLHDDAIRKRHAHYMLEEEPRAASDAVYDVTDINHPSRAYPDTPCVDDRP